MKKTKFEKLMEKAEKCICKALRSNSTKIRFYWQDRADRIKSKAYALNVGAF